MQMGRGAVKRKGKILQPLSILTSKGDLVTYVLTHKTTIVRKSYTSQATLQQNVCIRGEGLVLTKLLCQFFNDKKYFLIFVSLELPAE